MEEGRLMEVWRARCGGVSGGEFAWDGGGLTDACESGVWAWWGVSALEVDVAVGGVGRGLVGWSDGGCVGDARGCGWDVLVQCG